MRRSTDIPEALDKLLMAHAKKYSYAPGDVMVDALGAYLGYKFSRAELSKRREYHHDPERARKKAITRTRQQTAILKAIADPERNRILNQIMGV